MNSEDFEKRLKRQPLRQVPPEWRTEILSAALTQHATRNTPRRGPSFLSALTSQLSGLLWPRPVAWAALAAMWLVILGLNASAPRTSSNWARRTPPLSPQVLMAFHEQARLLVELIGSPDAPLAARPRSTVPKPRSERQPRLVAA